MRELYRRYGIVHAIYVLYTVDYVLDDFPPWRHSRINDIYIYYVPTVVVFEWPSVDAGRIVDG